MRKSFLENAKKNHQTNFRVTKLIFANKEQQVPAQKTFIFEFLSLFIEKQFKGKHEHHCNSVTKKLKVWGDLKIERQTWFQNHWPNFSKRKIN